MEKSVNYISLLVSAYLLGITTAHVSLTFPPARKLDLDFLDSARTKFPCGMPKGKFRTIIEAGSTVNVTWHLAYPHVGGFRLELLDENEKVKLQLSDPASTKTYVVGDPTAQWHTVKIPEDPCEGCTMRLVREAKEWGSYRFWSCADISIVKSNDYKENCLGRGNAGPNSSCSCYKGYWGPRCQYKDECDIDSDCGKGKCIDIGGTTIPRKQCFCSAEYHGERCALKNKDTLPTPENLQLSSHKEIVLSKRMSLYHRIVSDHSGSEANKEIEFVLIFNGTSYGAVGWKPSSIDKSCKSMPAIEETSAFLRKTRAARGKPQKSNPTLLEPLHTPERIMAGPESSMNSKRSTKGKSTTKPHHGPESSVAEPEPVPEPETEPKPETDGKAEPEVSSDCKGEPEGEPKSNIKASPHTEPENAASEPKPEAEPTNEPKSKPESAASEPESQPEAAASEPESAVSEPKSEPEAAASEPEPEGAASEPKPEAAASEPESNPESSASEPESKPEASASEPKPEAAASEPESKPESSASEPESKPESSASEPEPKPEVAVSEPESQPESAATEPKSEPEGTSEPESEPKSQPEVSRSPKSKREPHPESEPSSEPESVPEKTALLGAEPETAADESVAAAVFVEPEPNDQILDDVSPYRLERKLTPYTPTDGLHSMDCADIVIGTARGIHSRIRDFYTRDRSTPRLDTIYGGTEDITSATGWEKDGITTIIFRRKVDTGDPTDHILSGPMTVIWSRGQEHGEYVHSPKSGIEREQPSIPNFYTQDELKYHGQKDQRGVVKFKVSFS